MIEREDVTGTGNGTITKFAPHLCDVRANRDIYEPLI